jgi:hypothetical protein
VLNATDYTGELMKNNTLNSISQKGNTIEVSLKGSLERLHHTKS